MANLTAGSLVYNFDIEGQDKVDSALDNNKQKISGLASEAEKTSKRTGNAFTKTASSIGGAFTNIASTVGRIGFNTLEAGATGAGAAMVALGVKGITSANELQSLQLSMNGLTHSVNLGAQAMAGALKYAQQSPFQLTDVAATTKTLIAFGQTATDAVKSLDLLGNISITTGVPLQAIGDIFGRVSAQGKLMNQDIQQLTENGVAILPALQNQLHLTAQQVQDLASSGGISFGQFRTALASLVDPSILAQLTNTLPRQLDRLNGSLRILSNAFVGVNVTAAAGFTAAANGMDVAVTNLVRSAADALRSPALLAAATAIGNQLAVMVAGIAKFIGPIVSGIATMSGEIGKFGALALPILGLAIGGFSGLAADIPVIGRLVGGLTGPIGLLVGLFGTMLASSPQLRAAFGTAFGVLADTFKQLAPTFSVVAGMLGQIAGAIGNALAPLVSGLAQAFVTLLGALAPIIPILGQFALDIIQKVLLPIMPSLVQVFQILASAVAQILVAITPLIPPLTQLALQILQQVLLPIMPSIVQLVQLFAIAITMVLQAISPLMPQIIGLASLLVSAMAPILPQLIQLFIQLVVALLPLLPPILQLVTVLLPPLVSLITVTANIFSTLLVASLQLAIGAVGLVIAVIEKLSFAIGRVISWAANFLGTFISAFSGVKKAAGDQIGAVLVFFNRLPGQILGVLGDLGSVLYSAGADLIKGLLKGMGSLLGTIGSFFISKLPAFIRDPFKKALGIHSPSTVFAGYGKNIVQGLANGIAGASNLVSGAMSDLNDQLGVSGNVSVGASLARPVVASGADFPGSSTSQPAGAHQIVIHQHFDGVMTRSRSDLRAIMKDGLDAVNDELRARGAPEIGGGALTVGSSTAA